LVRYAARTRVTPPDPQQLWNVLAPRHNIGVLRRSGCVAIVRAIAADTKSRLGEAAREYGEAAAISDVAPI